MDVTAARDPVQRDAHDQRFSFSSTYFTGMMPEQENVLERPETAAWLMVS